MSAPRSAPLVQEFRRAGLPLSWYYAVTLLVPLANGAAFSDAFVTHAVVVLLVPLAIVVAMTALRITIRKPGIFLFSRRTSGCAFMQAVPTTKPPCGGTKPTKHGDSIQETS